MGGHPLYFRGDNRVRLDLHQYLRRERIIVLDLRSAPLRRPLEPSARNKFAMNSRPIRGSSPARPDPAVCRIISTNSLFADPKITRDKAQCFVQPS